MHPPATGVDLMIYFLCPSAGLAVQIPQRVEVDARPEVLFHKAEGRLDLTFGFRLVGTADPWHEAVIRSEVQGLLVEVELAALLVDQHRLHAIRQEALGHAAEITKGMHHAVQQVMDNCEVRAELLLRRYLGAFNAVSGCNLTAPSVVPTARIRPSGLKADIDAVAPWRGISPRPVNGRRKNW